MRTALLFALAAFAPAALAADLTPENPLHVGNAVAVDPLGLGIWVIREELDSVQWVPVAGDQERIPVGAWPQRVVVDGSGRAFVSCRGDGTVRVLQTDGVQRTVHVGAEPLALALDASERTLFVGLLTERAVAVVDTASLEVIHRAPVDAEPQALAWTTSGLVVLPRRDANRLWVLAEGALARSLPLDGFESNGRFLLPHRDGVVVLRTQATTGLPRRPEGAATSRYGGADDSPPETVLSEWVEDLKPGRRERPKRIDLGMTDVSGAAFLPNGQLAVVSRAEGEVCLAAVWGVPGGPGCDRGHADRGFVGLAVGPYGALFTASAFSRELTTVDVQPGASPRFTLAATPLAGANVDAQLARGRQLFYALSPEAGQALACASCHPDGRDDGLVWAHGTFERGQTPTLAGRVNRPGPFMWHGSAKTLEASLQATAKRLGRTAFLREDARALARFLREGLRPVSLPEPAPEAQVAIARGKALFESDAVGCADCHPAGSGFTDGQVHDVSSVSRPEALEVKAGCRDSRRGDCANPTAFLTPGLRAVATTAPYLHDGSRATLRELLGEHRVEMGRTEQLSPAELSALVAYVQTL